MRPGQAVRVMVRPEALTLREPDSQPQNRSRNAVLGVVEEVVYLGQTVRYMVHIDPLRLMVRTPHLPSDSIFARGTEVMVTWPRTATLILQ
jgi:ABC-type Fe3+/spermidine/putrescine transport system ATPase subunit